MADSGSNHGRRPDAPSPPNFDSWDRKLSHHASTEKAVQPLLQKFDSHASTTSRARSTTQPPTTVAAAVQHMENNGRLFSHEMQSEYIAHAIGQGGVQSGYNTSSALGLPEPKRDKGSAAAAFVFTRQLPSNQRVTTTLSEGQVGAGADAMLVFRPTMFENPAQPAFFKTVDGAHHSTSIMPERAKKGDHIRRASDEIAKSSDKIFHANQEQGVFGSVPMKHLAAVVLKTKDGEQETRKQEFLDHLHSTYRGDVLPPIEDRKQIKAKAGGKPPSTETMIQRHEAFQQRVVGQSLHDHLEHLINEDTKPGAKRRQVADLIVPLSHDTRRTDVAGHVPARPSNVAVHERNPRLEQPNEAFFKPRR
ncbi:MAG TPA: hypothetical protein VEC06_06545 [Paucimonas sp.]|nr:hypothetical protein [Paucimonas sp.]